MGSSRPVRRLSFLGEEYVGGDYLDVLALPGREPEMAGEMIKHLLKERSFDILDLDGVAADSPSLSQLVWYFATDVEHRYQYQLAPRDLCPRVRLDGAWEEVLKRSIRASSFGKALRKLQKMPDFSFRTVTDAAEVGAAFDRFRALHEKARTGRGGSDAMGHPILENFQREAALRLARAGLLQFAELWVEGECRASNYLLMGPGRCYAYQGGYDPAWYKYSVGLVLDGLALEQALDRGGKFMDFLRGAEIYKFNWATETRSTLTLRVANRRLPVKLLLARQRVGEAARSAIQAIAQALLPEQRLEALRHLHKSRERRRRLGALGEVSGQPDELLPLPLPQTHDS